MSLLTPELLRRLEQFQLLAARRVHPSPSAKRMNVNSRGCKPTEHGRKTNSTLKGSNKFPPVRVFPNRPVSNPPTTPSFRPFRAATFLTAVPWFGPFRADVLWLPVPWVSPTAIRVVRLRRTGGSNLRRHYYSTSPRRDCNSTTP